MGGHSAKPVADTCLDGIEHGLLRLRRIDEKEPRRIGSQARLVPTPHTHGEVDSTLLDGILGASLLLAALCHQRVDIQKNREVGKQSTGRQIGYYVGVRLRDP